MSKGQGEVVMKKENPSCSDPILIYGYASRSSIQISGRVYFGLSYPLTTAEIESFKLYSIDVAGAGGEFVDYLNDYFYYVSIPVHISDRESR